MLQVLDFRQCASSVPPIGPPTPPESAVGDTSRAQEYKTRLIDATRAGDVNIQKIWLEATYVCNQQERAHLVSFFQNQLPFDPTACSQLDRFLCRKLKGLWNIWPWEVTDKIPDCMSRRWLGDLVALAETDLSMERVVEFINEAFECRVGRKEPLKALRGVSAVHWWTPRDLESAMASINAQSSVESHSHSPPPRDEEMSNVGPQVSLEFGVTMRKKNGKRSLHASQSMQRKLPSAAVQSERPIKRPKTDKDGIHEVNQQQETHVRRLSRIDEGEEDGETEASGLQEVQSGGRANHAKDNFQQDDGNVSEEEIEMSLENGRGFVATINDIISTPSPGMKQARVSIDSDHAPFELLKSTSKPLSTDEKVERWSCPDLLSIVGPNSSREQSPLPLNYDDSSGLRPQIDGTADLDDGSHAKDKYHLELEPEPEAEPSQPAIRNDVMLSVLPREEDIGATPDYGQKCHAGASQANAAVSTKTGAGGDGVESDKHASLQSPPVDLSRWKDGCWLNDEDIDNALQLLSCRSCKVLSAAYCDVPDERPFGMLRLADEYDRIILPLPLTRPERHWCLGVINLKTGVIQFFNPWPHAEYTGDASSLLQRFARTLSDRFEKYQQRQWTFHEMNSAPKQNNGYDCGVFTIVVAYHLMIGESVCETIDGHFWRPVIAGMLHFAHADHLKSFNNNAAGQLSGYLEELSSTVMRKSVRSTASQNIEQLHQTHEKLRMSVKAINSIIEFIQRILGHISIEINTSLPQVPFEEQLSILERLADLSHRENAASFAPEVTQSILDSRARICKVKEAKDLHTGSLVRLDKIWNVGAWLTMAHRANTMELARSTKQKLDEALVAAEAESRRVLEEALAGVEAVRVLRARVEG